MAAAAAMAALVVVCSPAALVHLHRASPTGVARSAEPGLATHTTGKQTGNASGQYGHVYGRGAGLLSASLRGERAVGLHSLQSGATPEWLTNMVCR